jgi:multimeric flavodoxin WrbA
LQNTRPSSCRVIVYYSLYGHVFKLAQAVKEGAESVKGAEMLFRRVEEFDNVLKKTADDKYLSQVREQQKDIPVCTLDDLSAADAVLFGSPTRYGNMTAQMKQLIDSTASLWLKGEMEGKPAGVFTSTASTMVARKRDREKAGGYATFASHVSSIPGYQRDSVERQSSFKTRVRTCSKR